MKIISTLFVLLILNSFSWAQFEHGAVSIGYNIGSVTMDPFLYKHTPALMNAGVEMKEELASPSFSNANVAISLFAIEPGSYIEFGTDLPLLVASDGEFKLQMKESDLAFFKFSKGWAFLDDKLSLMFGAQFAYNLMEVEEVTELPDHERHEVQDVYSTGNSGQEATYFISQYGGSATGLNCNIFYAPNEQFGVRFGFDYNHLHKNGIYLNNSFGDYRHRGVLLKEEITAYYYFKEDGRFGVKLAYSMVQKSSTSTYKTTGEPTILPDLSSQVNMMKFSLLLPTFGKDAN